jgi:hypothetical protein
LRVPYKPMCRQSLATGRVPVPFILPSIIRAPKSVRPHPFA